MPTLGTGLARVARVNRHQFPTAPVLFVCEYAAKHPPAWSQDRLVQSRFGRNVAPWFLQPTLRRLRHGVVLHREGYRCGPSEIVGANEIFDGADVMRRLLGQRGVPAVLEQ